MDDSHPSPGPRLPRAACGECAYIFRRNTVTPPPPVLCLVGGGGAPREMHSPARGLILLESLRNMGFDLQGFFLGFGPQRGRQVVSPRCEEASPGPRPVCSVYLTRLLKHHRSPSRSLPRAALACCLLRCHAMPLDTRGTPAWPAQTRHCKKEIISVHTHSTKKNLSHVSENLRKRLFDRHDEVFGKRRVTSKVTGLGLSGASCSFGVTSVSPAAASCSRPLAAEGTCCRRESIRDFIGVGSL